MAYYTVCHLLQGGVLDGSQTGKYGIRYAILSMWNLVSTSGYVLRADQLTTEVWDFVFFGGELTKDSGISEEALL